LGFSTYEAKAYYALLRKHPAIGYEVSKLAQIPPSKIYETLTKLKNRGAVLDSQSEPIQYYPVDPVVLLREIQQRTEKNIESILSDLATLPPVEAFELTWNLRGDDAINGKIIEIVRQSEQEVFASLWPRQIPALEECLHSAMTRGVYVVVALFGQCQVSANEVINLEACSHNVRSRAGSNLCTVIKDNREVVIGELSDTIHLSTGVWTKTPSLVLVAKEYIKHDIMFNILASNIGSEEYKEIYRDNAIIGRLQQAK